MRHVAVVLLLALACAGGARAAVLPSFPAQSVRAGETLEVPIPAIGSGESWRLAIERGPPGATLRRVAGGAHRLRWTTPADLAPETVLVLLAVAADDPSRRERRRLVVRRADVSPGLANGRADGRADWLDPPRSPAGGQGAVEKPPAPTLPNAGGTTATTESESVRNVPPEIGEIPSQRLVAGQPWQLYLRVRDPDGDPPELSARGLPEGATLKDDGGGWYRFDWTPTHASGEAVEVSVVALDARDPALRAERLLRLEVIGPAGAPSVAATGPSSTPSPEPASEPPPAVPRLEPLANQIVSAGRTVTFRVDATLADGRRPIVHIDRLPRNASFDEQDDGTRVFHWPTGEGDQGEHRFRITALHPDDDTLGTEVDTLVIVGDPSRAVTVPFDGGEPGAASAAPASASEPPPSLPADLAPPDSRPPSPSGIGTGPASPDTPTAGATAGPTPEPIPEPPSEPTVEPAPDAYFAPLPAPDAAGMPPPVPGAGPAYVADPAYPDVGGAAGIAYDAEGNPVDPTLSIEQAPSAGPEFESGY